MMFNIYINYKNLVYFITTKILNKRQVRWAEIFKKYKFIIYYILEKNNNKINVLSCRPNLIKKKIKNMFVIEIAFR